MWNGVERLSAVLSGAVAVVVLATAVGCEPAKPLTAEAAVPVIGQPCKDQECFDTAEAAVSRLMAVAEAKDHEGMRRLFGPVTSELVSGDPVADNLAFERLASHAKEKVALEPQGANDNERILVIGKAAWPFPIPLVRPAGGRWFFDTAAGKEEILARRIGRNELDTIVTCRSYLEAQREYASKDRNNDGLFQYATRFRSHSGKHDGLYWEAAPDDEQSPFGPLMAEAAIGGYDLWEKGAGPQPYQGYLYRILTRQGRDAPGGKYDYIINGRMIAGFAMVAWPVKYDSSGVMTFLVNHQGRVYQKDLGPKTAELVEKMTEFNPDHTWTEVQGQP
jgi:hypothetical protein